MPGPEADAEVRAAGCLSAACAHGDLCLGPRSVWKEPWREEGAWNWKGADKGGGPSYPCCGWLKEGEEEGGEDIENVVAAVVGIGRIGSGKAEVVDSDLDDGESEDNWGNKFVGVDCVHEEVEVRG